MLVSTRDHARAVSKIINKIAGFKIVKQTPIKLENSWQIPFAKGKLSCPAKLVKRKVCPSKRIKRKHFVVGETIGKANSSRLSITTLH